MLLAASVVGLTRLWLGGVPLTDQPGSVLPASMVQLTPVPAGRSSVTLSPVASPAPLLVSVTVKPIGEVAPTLTASAVFVMVTTGQSTVSEAEAEPEPSLAVVKLAVLV